jgi:hypothetical protein
MNDNNLSKGGQNDRELEELLCLAYLFTHSNFDVDLDESEDPVADNVELFSGLFVN